MGLYDGRGSHADALPRSMPADFASNARYCRAIRERNPFIVSELTRPL